MVRTDLLLQLAGVEPNSEEGLRLAAELRHATADRLKKAAGVESGSTEESSFAAEVSRRVRSGGDAPMRLAAAIETALNQRNTEAPGVIHDSEGRYLADVCFALGSDGTPFMIADAASFDRERSQSLRRLRIAETIFLLLPVEDTGLLANAYKIADPLIWSLGGGRWKHVRKGTATDDEGFERVVAYALD